MEYIQSKQNQRIKDYRKLHLAKNRKKTGKYLIEGEHLLEEALAYHASIEVVLVTSSYYESHVNDIDPINQSSTEILILSDEVMDSLAFTQHTQGVMALVKKESDKFSNKELIGSHYLLCDGIQDPGNLGTMIRTADAAGFDGVLLAEGCVDLYNDKVIRASQGSLWHLPIYETSNDQLLKAIQTAKLPIYCTAVNQDAEDYRKHIGSKCVLVLGNEGQGVGTYWMKEAEKSVYIPMPGKAESLNVSIAAGILMFAWKQWQGEPNNH
ncbi:TrmH family RNA methyltransferase [Facklamia miroungae]|uniref:TrmH family RNA methyltransferase n=1 Tax=Facklamia miroungae TaxID=120956 RepID=UPI000B7D5743|nr:RNA methyltransferase [Facklamia miroungae]NKZ30169.1 RNA methyltransferase [Facklamia miroungae]